MRVMDHCGYNSGCEGLNITTALGLTESLNKYYEYEYT